MRFKAILFDLGGTLIQTPEISEIMKQMLESKSILCSIEKITKAREDADNIMGYKDLPNLRGEFWIKWNTEILKNLRVNEDREFLAKWISDAWWDYAKSDFIPKSEKFCEH